MLTAKEARRIADNHKGEQEVTLVLEKILEAAKIHDYYVYINNLKYCSYVSERLIDLEYSVLLYSDNSIHVSW